MMNKIKNKGYRNTDYEWFCKLPKKTLNKYSGRWIALKNKKILSSGYNIKKVIYGAKKTVEEPIIVKIPHEKEILIL